MGYRFKIFAPLRETKQTAAWVDKTPPEGQPNAQ